MYIPKKNTYDSPWVKHVQVMTEGSFAGSVFDNSTGKSTKIEANSQSYNEFNGDAFSGGGFTESNSAGVEWDAAF